MRQTTDFIGHVGVEPALNGEQIGHLAHLRAAARGDGQPPFTSGWLASDDGRCLTVDGDERYGDAAEWLRYLIRCFLKPGGAQLDGMVVGCRRDTKELFTIQVRANRVSERPLRPYSTQPRTARRPPEPRRVPTAKVIDLAARRAQG
jgi:hypothetical protein